MMRLTIPKPCHEDWNKMNPTEKGRHCNVCCKTVVDFTSMNDEEVKYFFINKKKEESVCGRFKTEQLQRINIQLPSNIYAISMPLWKSFLTACLLAFSSMLFSCDALIGQTETLGETIPFVMAKDNTGLPLLPPAPIMLGVTFPQIDTPTTSTCNTIKGDTIYVESIVQGDVSIKPVENVIPQESLPAIEEPKNQETMLTGKVAVDIDTSISPKRIDTIKKQPMTDSTTCDSEKKNYL